MSSDRELSVANQFLLGCCKKEKMEIYIVVIGQRQRISRNRSGFSRKPLWKLVKKQAFTCLKIGKQLRQNDEKG